ncbi:MAG: hypothetical protein R3350_06865 [Saprospiraceae bacterium]|nr:hypothetical protein [Saprospiraceae bacterium]
MATEMTKDKPLYITFLEDRRVYNLVEAYWRRLFHGLFDEANFSFHPFYNKHFRNGQKEYDANPIFDAYFPARHKLVRILQEMPEPDAPPLTAWIDHWPAAEMDAAERPRPDDPEKALMPIPELVIALSLSRETAALTRCFLKQWILEDFNAEEMEKAIEEKTGHWYADE